MTTLAQRSAAHCLSMIAPFESTDEALAQGQEEFHRFITALYRGMAEDPEEYFVFPAPYEAYIAKRRLRPVKTEKEHAGDSRESTLRNTFQQAIQFYARWFFELGTRCRRLDEQGGLVLDDAAYRDALSRMERFRGAEHHADRYALLARLGIRTVEENGEVVVSHAAYPHMMEGLLYLCRAPESAYKYMNYLRLDYQNACAPVPPVADILKTLPAHSADAVRRLEAQLADRKFRTKIRPLRGITSDFRWKVEYSVRGKNVCGFYADCDSLMLCVYFNSSRNITALARELADEDPALFSWFRAQFPERLCRCPHNRRVVFGEETRHICGLSNRAEIVDPGPEDVERAVTVLRRFRSRAQ